MRGARFGLGAKGHDGHGRVSSWHWRSAIIAVLSTAGAMAMVALTPAIADAQPLASFAYVPDVDGSFVSEINTSNRAVVARFQVTPVGESVSGPVAVTPNGAFAYVATFEKGLAEISTSTNTVVAHVPLGGPPKDMAITPNGQFIYLLTYPTVTVISTSTNTVVATVPTGIGTGTYHLAVSPSGGFVYVTSDSGVLVINTSTNTLAATVPVPAGYIPSGVAIAPSGAFAYVTSGVGVSGRVLEINTSTNTVVATIPTGKDLEGMAITPNGAFAYVTSETYEGVVGAVYVINTATNTVVATVPVGQHPDAVAITPDGAFAYVANFNENVSVISTATNTVLTTVPVEGVLTDIAITPPIMGPETHTTPCSATNTNGCLPPCSAANTNGCLPPCRATYTNGCLPPCSAANTNGCLPPCGAANTNGCLLPPHPRRISPTAAFALPPARQCVSHRRFTIHARTLPGITWVGAVIKINGKRVKSLGRSRITALVNLVGLPKGTFVLSITANASNGQSVTGTRTYHTCVPKRKNHYPAPRL